MEECRKTYDDAVIGCNDKTKMFGIVEFNNNKATTHNLVMCDSDEVYETYKSQFENKLFDLNYVSEYESVQVAASRINSGKNNNVLKLNCPTAINELIDKCENTKFVMFSEHLLCGVKLNEEKIYSPVCNIYVNESYDSELWKSRLFCSADTIKTFNMIAQGLSEATLNTNVMSELTEAMTEVGYKVSKTSDTSLTFWSVNECGEFLPMCIADVVIDNNSEEQNGESEQENNVIDACIGNVEIPDAVVNQNDVEQINTMLKHQKQDTNVKQFIIQLENTKIDNAACAQQIIEEKGGASEFFKDAPELLDAYNKIIADEECEITIDMEGKPEYYDTMYKTLLALFAPKVCDCGCTQIGNVKLCKKCECVDCKCDESVINESALLNADEFIKILSESVDMLDELDKKVNGLGCTNGIADVRAEFNVALHIFSDAIQELISKQHTFED